MPELHLHSSETRTPHPRGKGKLIGQKPPLKLNDVWAIRIRFEIKKKKRALALFNLAIDRKLRSCDLAGQ